MSNTQHNKSNSEESKCKNDEPLDEFPRKVIGMYPSGFWAGDEKNSSILIRGGVFLLLSGSFFMMYALVLYMLFKYMLNVWNTYIYVCVLGVSAILTYITVKYVGSLGMLKNKKFAATIIPIEDISFDEAVNRIKKVLSSYPKDSYRTEQEENYYKFEFNKLGIAISIYKSDKGLYGQYIIIHMYLRNKGDDELYCHMKNNISKAFGISSYTAQYDPNIY